MIELRITCPSCSKRVTGDHGKIELDLTHGEMNVECGWCEGEWKLSVPIEEAPMPRSRRDYMPPWKQKMLGL
jgi:uncharacterized Zn-finger protein